MAKAKYLLLFLITGTFHPNKGIPLSTHPPFSYFKIPLSVLNQVLSIISDF